MAPKRKNTDMMAGPNDDLSEQPVASWLRNLSVLALAHAIGVMTFTGMIAMAPVIRQDLALSATQFGLLASAYAVTQGIFGLPVGGVIDRIGVRRALIAANLLASLGALLLGTAMGVKQTGVPLGGIIGASLGALAMQIEWRTLLYVIGGSATLGAMACVWLPRGGDATARIRFNILSDIRTILTDRNLNIFNIGVGFYQAAQFNFLAYITLFMREAVQASQPLAASCLGIAQAASAIGRLGWGAVSDFLCHGRRKPVLVTMGSVGMMSLIVLSFVSPGWVVLGMILTVVIGLTVPGYVALVQTIVVEAAQPRLAATAVGYNRIYAAAGATLGPPIFGATVDLMDGYSAGWLMTGGTLLAAILLIGVLFHEHPRSPR
jgi:predicted MFS family arabinose efflux permease